MLIFSSPCRRPLRLLRYELFTNCKKFLETIMLASKWTRLFGSFYRKQEQRNIWKGCPVFPDRMVQAELHEKLSLIPVSGFRGRFSINGTDLYTMVNAIPGRNLPVLNSEPTGFAHANGEQPWFCIMRRVKSHTMSAISLRYWENSWMKAQLSTATTRLWFGFFRCRVDVLQSQFSRRTMIGIAELWMCVYRQYFDERHGVRPIPDLLLRQPGDSVRVKLDR